MTRTLSKIPLSLAVLLATLGLAACNKGPTEPSAETAAATDPATELSATAPEDDAAALAAREEELAAREAELKAQQDELDKARKQVEAAKATTPKTSTAARTNVVPAPGASATLASNTAASSVKKVPATPIVVPSGTPMRIELTKSVNTKLARLGDRVEARLASDLVVADRRAASSGSTVSGSVTELVSGSDKIGGIPTVGITFDSLVAANGATVPIMARYRQQGVSETGRDAAKIAGGAVAGAVIGHQVDDDKGTVLGGILGGAAGAAAAKKTGGDLKLRAGTVLDVSTETSFSIY